MIKNAAYFFITAISVVVVLIFGKSLIIPFVFALLLWFTIRKIRLFADQVPFVKNSIPIWLKNVLISGLIIWVFGIISHIISSNINSLAHSYQKYEANVDHLIDDANATLSMDIEKFVNDNMGSFDFGEILRSIFNSVTDILSNAFMVIIYVLFIFLEEAYFHLKLKKVFRKKEKFKQFSSIIASIEQSVGRYLSLKTFISFVSGSLSYIALYLIGIDSPFFWAFLIFILSFIPIVGPLLGALFPAVFCLLQFGEFATGGMVLGAIGLIQILVGNVLEPKLMGDSMNLSPLVTIIALAFWGAVWGVTGMILSIPITVIMTIFFSNFPSTQPIAVMLSQRGRVEKS